jgi:hypothetical protein
MSHTNKSAMSLNLLKREYDIDVLEPRTYNERFLNLKLFEKVVDNIDELQEFIGLCYDAKKCQRIEWSGTKTIICNTFKNKKKDTLVLYSPSKSSPSGRHFSRTKSLQGLSRVLRHLICHERYTDIDIKNCHPVILVQLCKAYNFNCDHIEFYIANREPCLQELVECSKLSRDDCKDALLSLLNGGACNKIFNTCDVPNWFCDYADQMEVIIKSFASHEDCKEFVKEVKKTHGANPFNLNGKVMNKLLCKYENIILQHAIRFCSLNGVVVASPQFDGLIVEKTQPGISKNFLQNMQQFIFDKTGFSVEFAIKEMDQHTPLMEKLKSMKTKRESKKSLDKSVFESDEENNLVVDEKLVLNAVNGSHFDVAVILKTLIETECPKNIFVFKNANPVSKDHYLYVYNETTALYEIQSLSFLRRKIIELVPLFKQYGQSLLTEHEICEKKDEQPIVELVKQTQRLIVNIKSTPFQNYIINQFIDLMEGDNEFIQSHFDRIPHLLPIADKRVINLRTLEVIERSREHFFTKTTNNIFKESRPERGFVLEYIKSLLKTENDTYATSFLTLLGYFMTGENCLKIFPLGTGGGDNGKSLLMALLIKIMGEFIKKPNEKVFIQSKNNAVHEEHLTSLVGKRLAYIEEIPKNSKWNEAFIKSVSGGGNGNILDIRACGEKTQTVIIDCKLLAICNSYDVASFDDKDGFPNRLLNFHFKNKFEKNPTFWTKMFTFKDDLFTEMCYYVKTCFYDNEMIIDFTEEVRVSTDFLIADDDIVKRFFDEMISFTDNKKDRMQKKELFKLFDDYKRDIKNYSKIGLQEFYDRCVNKYKIPVHRDRMFTNIKLQVYSRFEDDEDDEEIFVKI